jgi:hypothetical protein
VLVRATVHPSQPQLRCFHHSELASTKRRSNEASTPSDHRAASDLRRRRCINTSTTSKQSGPLIQQAQQAPSQTSSLAVGPCVRHPSMIIVRRCPYSHAMDIASRPAQTTASQHITQPTTCTGNGMSYHQRPEIWRSPKRAASGIARTPQSCKGTPNAVLTAHANLGVSALHVPLVHAAVASRPRCSVPRLPTH